MKISLKSVLSTGLVVATLAGTFLTNFKVVTETNTTKSLEINFGVEKAIANGYEIPSPYVGDFEVWLVSDSDWQLNTRYVGHSWIALVVTKGYCCGN